MLDSLTRVELNFIPKVQVGYGPGNVLVRYDNPIDRLYMTPAGENNSVINCLKNP